MEPEEISPLKSKKFLKIILGVLAVFVLLMGTAFVLTAMKNTRQGAEVIQTPAPAQKDLTQEEKMRILSDLTQLTPEGTTSQKDKVRILQNLAKQVPKSPEVSNEEKTRILQELAARAGQ